MRSEAISEGRLAKGPRIAWIVDKGPSLWFWTTEPQRKHDHSQETKDRRVGSNFKLRHPSREVHLFVSYHHLRCTVSSKSPLLPATSSYKDNWNLPTYSTSIFCRWHRSPLCARLSTGYRERTRWTRVCTVSLVSLLPHMILMSTCLFSPTTTPVHRW
jgi:hypothetical protein